eukprot:CAMPEP_0194270260 /NCGR_PEP_ID=MMETSP0169-20130528/4284_1 /TAXON_ID=218684 /ORGANISM="Corethron pennatum, Strain L29A3" /LENGTH=173 /DNA_ID=CAMNT_0039012241 /DNA_START=70 /DNA_END=587 /DNA_ORIENTATION=-
MLRATAFVSSVRTRLPATGRGRFLGAVASDGATKPTLRGVIFDMDGTLTVPNLDFAEMYSRAGVDPSEDILTAIEKMPEDRARSAQAVIEEMEEEGRRTLALRPGAAQMGAWLSSHGVPTALVTRNTEATVRSLEELWEKAGAAPFDVTIARDSRGGSVPSKPDPASLGIVAG